MMSYQPQITTPIFFAYDSTNQTISTNTQLDLDSSLYAGSLASNDLTVIQRSTAIADVKYNMSSSGLRAYTVIRSDTTETVAQGFNLHGDGGGSNGVCDEISYSTFGPTNLNIFCDPKFTSDITMQANYTRLTGALIS